MLATDQKPQNKLTLESFNHSESVNRQIFEFAKKLAEQIASEEPEVTDYEMQVANGSLEFNLKLKIHNGKLIDLIPEINSTQFAAINGTLDYKKSQTPYERFLIRVEVLKIIVGRALTAQAYLADKNKLSGSNLPKID